MKCQQSVDFNMGKACEERMTRIRVLIGNDNSVWIQCKTAEHLVLRGCFRQEKLSASADKKLSMKRGEKFQPNTLQIQGWRHEFSDGGRTLPTSGLKYGFQGTINAKTLRKNRITPSDRELVCSYGGL